MFSTDSTTNSSWLSIYLIARFGSVHLKLTDSAGRLHRLPEGTQHYIEHLTYRQHLHDALSHIELEYSVTPNAVVTHNQTIWFADRVKLDRSRGVSQALDIAKHLMSVLWPPPTEHMDNIRLDGVARDVRTELIHRHTDVTYFDVINLFATLYPDHPMRYDLLGSEESIASITASDVALGLQALQSSVRSVNFFGTNLPDGLVDAASELVDGMRPKCIEPLMLHEPVSRANSLKTAGFPSKRENARAMVGFRLAPFRTGLSEERDIRRFLTEKVLHFRHFHGTPLPMHVSWPHARAMYGAANLDPLFYIDPERLRGVVTDVVAAMKKALQKAAGPGFNAAIEMKFSELHERRELVAMLASAADLFGWPLPELIDALPTLTADDCRSIIEEVVAASASASLAYMSPCVGLV